MTLQRKLQFLKGVNLIQ